MKNIFTAALIFLLTACNNGNPVEKEFDKEGQTLKVTVVFVNSEREMSRHAFDYMKGVRGQALYSKEDNECKIVTYEPRYIDKDPTMTLGHELMHCLYGDYHK